MKILKKYIYFIHHKNNHIDILQYKIKAILQFKVQFINIS